MYNTLYRCLYCMLPKTNPTVSIHMLPLKSSRPIPFEPPFFPPPKSPPKIGLHIVSEVYNGFHHVGDGQNGADDPLWGKGRTPRGNFREGFSKRFSGKRNNGIQGLAQHKPAKTKFAFRKNKVNQICCEKIVHQRSLPFNILQGLISELPKIR